MRRLIIALLATSLVVACSQKERARRQPIDLVIYGTLESRAFEPLADEFERRNPQITVHYRKVNAAPLYEDYLQNHSRHANRADILISSAMDLQVKLVNDGYAATHHSTLTEQLPAWAKWRDQAFAFTLEPSVMVFNKDLMRGRTITSSRGQLIDVINADPAFWRNRICTYDITGSSVGYMMAAQDSREGIGYGSLMQVFRTVGVETSGTTAGIFKEVEKGRCAMGYNVLASYAWRRQAAGAPIMIVYPKDYTLAISRVAVIPADAPHIEVARAFVDYLLSPAGQATLVKRSELGAVRSDLAHSLAGAAAAASGPIRPVTLGPGLLTDLDRLKKQRLLDLWRRSVSRPAQNSDTAEEPPSL